MIVNSAQMRPLLVLVTQPDRAVAIYKGGEDTIGAMVQTRRAGEQNPHGGDVLVNVDRKAQGPASLGHILASFLIGASWARKDLSIIAMFSILSWSSLV
jgi:hypothetical protein